MQNERRLERQVKKTLEGIVEAGEPLIREGIEATRAYHQAEDDGRPAAEIERLRLVADSLYEAVINFQTRRGNLKMRDLH